MADNKKIRGKQDRSKVDANDPSEVEWLHRKFSKRSRGQIIKAIKTAGPGRKKISTRLENPVKG